jgi:NTP pyrophosphatase (non-canonical NTP hydrolase)
MTITGNVFRDLFNMHRQFGFHEQKFDKKALLHRVEFLQEELDEIKDAIVNKDAGAVLDGLIDLVVVAIGTIDLCNADGEIAWERVMNANNAKKVGFNKTRPNSDGVDLIKPEGWLPPVLDDLVGNLRAVLFEGTVLDAKFVNYQSHPSPFDDKILGEVDSESSNGNEHIDMIVHYTKDRSAVRVLEDCIALMRLKAQDYTSSNSSVKPAEYYPNGIDDLVYMIDVLKRLRMISVLDNMKAGGLPNFDGLRDILQDRIVYLALAIEFIDGEMDGRIPDTDIWNRKVTRTIGEAQDN